MRPSNSQDDWPSVEESKRAGGKWIDRVSSMEISEGNSLGKGWTELIGEDLSSLSDLFDRCPLPAVI